VQPGATHSHPHNGSLAQNRPITRQTNLLQAVQVELAVSDVRRVGGREDDVKMLPETCGVVEGGAGGRELSAPIVRVETVALARIEPVSVPRVEPVLRLINAAPATPAVEPQPIRLTAIAAPWAGPADERWTGAALRRAREARGLTLSQVADRTKVTRHHIENIEGDRFELLPSYVYLRGILLSLAKELQLDALRVCRSYLDLAREATGA
jgi:hypothetical protein